MIRRSPLLALGSKKKELRSLFSKKKLHPRIRKFVPDSPTSLHSSDIEEDEEEDDVVQDDDNDDKVGNNEVDDKDLPESTLKAFQRLGLHSALIHQLYLKFNITSPTPIQKAVFSKLLPKFSSQHGLIQKNVFIQSETGSGKTFCFLLPILQTLLFSGESSTLAENRSVGPLALILVPTRELAQQIHQTVETVLNFPKTGRCCPHWLVSGTLVGGDKRKSEKQRIRKGLNIIISTPGRFMDHLTSTSSLNLSKVRWVVLDEADRLLDMGFQKALFTIFDTLKEAPLVIDVHEPSAWPKAERLVYLCSATIHEKYKVLLQRGILKEPILNVNLAGAETSLLLRPTPKSLHHQYLQIPLKWKLWALFTFLQYTVAKKVLIFFCTKASVNWMHAVVSRLFKDRPCFLLHGDLSQDERKTNLASFQESPQGVLLATDVAARGLDLPAIDYACQFDPPMDMMEYIHRAGRTARAGAAGTSLMLLLDHEVEFATKVLPSHHLKLTAFNTALFFRHTWGDHWELKLKKNYQFILEDTIQSDSDLREATIEAFCSHIKSYATYPASLKHIFHLKKLHMGHLATMYGLRDTPSTALLSLVPNASKRKEKEEKKTEKRHRDPSDLDDFHIYSTKNSEDGPSNVFLPLKRRKPLSFK